MTDTDGHCRTTEGGCVDLRETKYELDAQKADRSEVEEVEHKLDGLKNWAIGILSAICLQLLATIAGIALFLIRGK